MQKDIIYIDTEDDITSIIGKIKKGNEKVVALVPPRRTGMLQSAVNLRLLARTAKTSDKQLVIVTNSPALTNLAAAAKIPVAKTLQSKPELAQIDALEVDDGDDIIEGAQLPVGELVRTIDHTKDSAEDHLGNLNIDGESEIVPAAGEALTTKPAKKASKSGVKVPDFLKFRKKLFLIGGGILALVIFLVWAIWFAPSATVIINAKTSPAPVSATLKLGAASTNVDNNEIQSVTKTISKDVSVDFTATGSQLVGTSAKGTVIFKNCETMSAQTLPAGTSIVTNGLSYTTDASITVPGGSGSFFGCTTPGTSASVSVTAADIGSDYNVDSGTTFSVADHANSSGVYLRAVATSSVSGGESHQGTVVTQADYEKAAQALVDLPTDDIKSQLTSQFSNGEYIVDGSFTINRAAATSSPLVNAEAKDGKATLTSKTTFSLTAISKADMQSYMKEAINKQIDTSKQRIYNDGLDKLSFTGYSKNNSSVTVNFAATGQVGPNIDEGSIKDQVKGKQFGDAQALLQGIDGVSSADIKFSYFWVTTIPNDASRIKVEFQISNG